MFPWLLTALACKSEVSSTDLDCGDITVLENQIILMDLSLEAGVYKIPLEIAADDDLSFPQSFTIEYSFEKDGEILSGSIDDVSLIETDTDPYVSFNSHIADLAGYAGPVHLEIIPQNNNECFWPVAEIDFEIDNSLWQADICSVEINRFILNTADHEGSISIPYKLYQPYGWATHVEASYSTDGENYSPLTLAGEACEGFESSALGNQETSVRGESHCLVWDSSTDVPEDTTASVMLTCEVYGTKGGSDIQSITVQNDPTPEAGDLLLTEVTMSEDGSLNALEFLNTSGHSLDLSAVVLTFYKADGTLYKTPLNFSDYAINDNDLILDPSEYVVLLNQEQWEETGCEVPNDIQQIGLGKGSTWYPYDLDKSMQVTVADEVLVDLEFAQLIPEDDDAECMQEEVEVYRSRTYVGAADAENPYQSDLWGYSTGALVVCDAVTLYHDLGRISSEYLDACEE